MVARTAPTILALLGDGVPRAKGAILAALAGRHPKDEVARTLMRLAVTGGWSGTAAAQGQALTAATLPRRTISNMV